MNYLHILYTTFSVLDSIILIFRHNLHAVRLSVFTSNIWNNKLDRILFIAMSDIFQTNFWVFITFYHRSLEQIKALIKVFQYVLQTNIPIHEWWMIKALKSLVTEIKEIWIQHHRSYMLILTDTSPNKQLNSFNKLMVATKYGCTLRPKGEHHMALNVYRLKPTMQALDRFFTSNERLRKRLVWTPLLPTFGIVSRQQYFI